MDFRRKAIELYEAGKSPDEITKMIGFPIEEELLNKWVGENVVKQHKSFIFKLDKKQKKESDSEQKRKINQDLKEKLEELLKIIPEDIEIQTKLMYANINLKELEEARKIGYALIEKSPTREVLNGVAIIEELSNNYEKSIKLIKMILEEEPNNQALIKKIERMNGKATFNGKENYYRKIADLERKVMQLAEEKQGDLIRSGKEIDLVAILDEKYREIYKQVEEVARDLLEEHPEEVVAREKLIKSLYITNQKEEAEEQANELLSVYDKDEIALWYMSKIKREQFDLEKEKEYLERIIGNSEKRVNIRAQRELERVNGVLEKKKEKETFQKLQQESYTEEARYEFIEKTQKDFCEGNIRKEDIPRRIEEARKYPNYLKSLIELLKIQSHMTGEVDTKLNSLEAYIESEYTMIPEEYNFIMDEIVVTREEKRREKIINKHYNKQQYEKSNEQRQFSKEVIEHLKLGKITEKQMPQIIKKLESFEDKTRAIFLITKLYQIVYGRESAYKNLLKYNCISNLSNQDKERIGNMQRLLTSKDKTKTERSDEIRQLYLDKKNRKAMSYKKTVIKEEIIEYLNKDRTVQEIYNILSSKGISLKSITRVKSFYLRENKELNQKNHRLERYAENLLKQGYKLKDVYSLMEYDIPIPRLQTLTKEIKEKEDDTILK